MAEQIGARPGGGGLRIAILGPVKLALGPPFGGGLEAHTWQLAGGLRRRGHDVTLFAPDAPPGVTLVRSARWVPPEAGRRDISAGPEAVLSENHAHIDAFRRIVRDGERFDVVHDNSGHHLPVSFAGLLPVPMTTTLHTPPTSWMESALCLGAADLASIVTVSEHCARSWSEAVVCDEVIHNGVDTDLWQPTVGPRDGAVWLGRLVPEKGPHLAIEAARRAGEALRLAGPIHDDHYFRTAIAPLLGPDVRYEGHLGSEEAALLVRSAAVTLVTSMWDEPFGQVVAESLASGTPVAGFASGALPELVSPEVGVLVAPGDVDALARAIADAQGRSTADCRRRALEHFSLDRMLARYEAAFEAGTQSGRRSA